MEAGRKIGEATINTNTLRNFLKDVNDTDRIIPYMELSDLIKLDVQKDGRGSLVSAIRMLSRDEGKVFAAVPGIGVKLLTDEEITEEMGRKKRRAFNQNKKIKDLAENVEYEKLGTEKKIQYNSHLTWNRMVALFSSKKGLNKITQGVMTQQKVLDFNGTIKLFNVGKGGKEEEAPAT